MIHDFATAPRQSDWRANSGSVVVKSDTRDKLKAPKPRKLVMAILLVSVVVLVAQTLFIGADPVLDQQPDDAAKKEYAEAVLYSEGDSAVADDSDAVLFMDTDEPADVVEREAAHQPNKLVEVVPVINSVKAAQEKAPTQQKAKAVVVQQQEPVDPDYDFYDTLRQDSWPIPVNKGVYVDGELSKRERPVYKLQAASFRSKTDAYRLLGKLKARKLDAVVIQSVSTSGEYWYQVSVGPFVNTSRLNKAQDILVSMSMMPLKKRVR